MFTTRPELAGTHGMVATTHWLASAAGMAVLEDGGNAFDAAVTAGFVLQVVEPHLNGPGGEVPAVFLAAGQSQPRVLCGQGVAPAAATIEHYRGLGLELVPGSGMLAATVPGAWDAWLILLRDHGTKRLRDVLDRAIGYARNGFPLLPRIPDTIDTVSDLFVEHWPTSAALWMPDGRPPAAGSRFRNPVLADTWERLLAAAENAGADRETQIEAARLAWSSGFVADEIDSFARNAFLDDSGRAHAGLLTGQDMASWQASYEDALTVDHGEWTLVKCGAWTQGPVLAQQLRLLEGFADRLSYVDGIPTAETVHLAIECTKLAFADREAWYGDDPDVPLTALLSDDYTANRRALVSDQASFELRPGSPDGRPPRLPEFAVPYFVPAEEISGALGEPTVGNSGVVRGDTVHIDVVDAAGNMISATPSGGWLQSSPTIPALGFCLGTRAQMFTLERHFASSLRPGRRPRTTLSPSMALRDGVARMAFGTSGGDQQDQWQVCFWLAHIGAGLNMQQAIDAPAWHSGAFPSSFFPRYWQPGELVVESRIGDAAIAELRERGHLVTDAGPWILGRLTAVSRDPADGMLRAAANARGMQSYAVGR
ncbi:gamma-glutamyltransferase family protein [Kibdelosporangium phytohabitans]|uniref:Gamma-glutamyltransferase n=1 Tax=Kibdelosporangium phytohabitans TaxID=860235 RepID=A0A0N9HN13_9PSEU|nr:gamma-glutamyltransferase [Kibdelosporangium phytohabitans]ALG05589.1 gamma-glutamyltransferase [Kibdelosporangium phytohabitans]MBE1466446.1 gamma-glutamyltranspeptidase/glutathione hydrolase [Kibdelosporangium phytohabitans]